MRFLDEERRYFRAGIVLAGSHLTPRTRWKECCLILILPKVLISTSIIGRMKSRLNGNRFRKLRDFSYEWWPDTLTLIQRSSNEDIYLPLPPYTKKRVALCDQGSDANGEARCAIQ